MCRDLGVEHPRRLHVELCRSELLDWLALWQVDPWGPDRADRRAAVQSAWNRGAGFDTFQMEYPYVGDVSDDDDELLDLLDQDRDRKNNGSET